MNIIVGGGLYGCMIALLLDRYGEKVMLVEQESDLLTHASYNNQARVHGGYHYPRNRVTGIRSRANIQRFEDEFGFAMSILTPAYYAIAKTGSKVTGKQFEEFCLDIRSPFSPVKLDDKSLFNRHYIESAYRVDENVFNAGLLRKNLKDKLSKSTVDVRLDTKAGWISGEQGDMLVSLNNPGTCQSVKAKRVFNCTYSGLGKFRMRGQRIKTRLKHEITEMALVRMPESMKDVGITIMDGDFWSSLPFPDKDMHTLSHVGYTPHFSWEDDGDIDPYVVLADYKKTAKSRGQRMIMDAARFVPTIRDAQQIDSLWEVKTVLVKNERDDGRPILFEKHSTMPIWNILGGKVDNVFDLLDKIENELLHCETDQCLTDSRKLEIAGA